MMILFVLLTIFVVLFFPPIRRICVTQFLFQIMKKKMPTISKTEQDAIDAGTVWWEKSLLRGKPDWEMLKQVTPAELSKDEKTFIDGPVETLCGMVNDWETHQRGDLSQEVWVYLKEHGFFGMGIPKAYGGLAFSATGHSEVIQKIASRSVTAAVTTMVPNSLGPAELLLNYGTKTQKDYYLPRLARGEEVPCFALTGPDAGSDAGAMPDSGIVEMGLVDGKEILGIRLNWNKRYITLAPVSTLIGLAFRLYDPNHLLGKEEDIGITVALIPSDTKGVVVGQRHNPLYVPFQNGPTQGHDVFISLDSIIGGREYVGQGWRMLMESLAAGRAISLPALSCGTGKLACAVTSAYARVREQFGVSIGRFEGVSERVASIAISTYTVNAVRELSARAVDLGERPSVLSAIAKYNTTETMRKVVNDAMDVVGGKGIIAGPKNLLAHSYIAIPIGITVEGANILTRSMIVFGQGAIRCNPHILAEITAIQHEDAKQGLIEFDVALVSHVLSLAQGKFRALRFSLFSWIPTTQQESKLARSYQDVDRLSALFSIVADLSMVTLGGKLKQKESLSGRFADTLSGLYQASAVLKGFANQGEPEEERLIAEVAAQLQLYRAEQALKLALDNYPYPWIGKLLKLMVFPFGTKHQNISDVHLHAITQSVMEKGELRNHLAEGMYQPRSELPPEDMQPLEQLEQAMQVALECAPILTKLKDKYGRHAVKLISIKETVKKAVLDGLLNQEEQKQIEHWLSLRALVVAVDDFSPEELCHE
ncbi:MAG: acyl-CoA dehydrogenase [Ghiorsea sp.]